VSAGTAARATRPPFVLVAAAAAVAAAAVLPLAYLLWRGLLADADARALVPLSSTIDLTVDTVLLTGGVVVATLLVGAPLAWLVVRTDLPGRRWWGVAAALPLVVPSFIAALALVSAFAPRGALQRLLEPFGVERLPDVTGYWGSLLALTLSTYPYVFLLVAAGLRGIDHSAEEAARSLGLTPARVAWRVTLPALRPSLAAASLVVALYVLSDFGVVSVMGYSTLTVAIYNRYESLLAVDSAAILALVLVAVAVVVVLLAARLRRRGASHRSTPGAGRPTPLVRLGRWRWLALTYCGCVVGLFLVLPVAVLAWWSTQGDPLVDGGIAWGAALNTAGVALAAAALAALAALPVAILGWRYPSRAAALLERLTLVPNALPGIAVALALVFFGVRFGLVYQSLGLLVLAYLLRFLPFSIASTRASLETVSPRLEEAARGLGRSRLRVTTGVVLPLARSGILAGAALVFLSTVKELPATLLLRPIGFETLATEIWRGTTVGAYAAVAPSALLLLGLAVPLLVVLSWRHAWELGAPQ
jgi:iron(III) transport system permease protein